MLNRDNSQPDNIQIHLSNPTFLFFSVPELPKSDIQLTVSGSSSPIDPALPQPSSKKRRSPEASAEKNAQARERSWKILRLTATIAERDKTIETLIQENARLHELLENANLDSTLTGLSFRRPRS